MNINHVLIAFAVGFFTQTVIVSLSGDVAYTPDECDFEMYEGYSSYKQQYYCNLLLREAERKQLIKQIHELNK